jgi:hypothetical protein
LFRSVQLFVKGLHLRLDIMLLSRDGKKNGEDKDPKHNDHARDNKQILQHSYYYSKLTIKLLPPAGSAAQYRHLNSIFRWISSVIGEL